MRLSVFLIVAALACAPAAIAQTPSPAGAEAESARRTALSRRYLELMQQDSMATMVKGLVASQIQAAEVQFDISAADREFLAELNREMLDEVIAAMLDQLAAIYARTFTEAELEALVAFYGTEQGQAIVTKGMAAGMESATALMSAMGPLMAKMTDRMCARFGCSAEQMEAMRSPLERLPPPPAE